MSLVKDPICGMLLTEEEIVLTFVYFDETYAFCCVECHEMFAHAPERYVVHLAHSPEGHYGHLCPMQRTIRLQSLAHSELA